MNPCFRNSKGLCLNWSMIGLDDAEILPLDYLVQEESLLLWLHSYSARTDAQTPSASHLKIFKMRHGEQTSYLSAERSARLTLHFCSRVFPLEVNTPFSTLNFGVGYLLWSHRQSKHRRVEHQINNHLPLNIYQYIK